MNESNEIHRDIYVGMVAEEMAQSGYYGEDVTLYGFLANGELHSFDDEQECAETYLLALATGAEISRMTSMHKRCQKKRSAKKAAREELTSEMRAMLAAELAPFARRTVDLRALSDYTKGLAKPRSREQEAAIVGVMTLPTFGMKPEEREAVLDVKKSFEAPAANRHFFGFYEKKDARWQPVLNGALPTILKKMVYSRCAWPRFADPADAPRKREASLPAARRFRNIARADHGRGVSRNARCALRVATLI